MPKKLTVKLFIVQFSFGDLKEAKYIFHLLPVQDYQNS